MLMKHGIQMFSFFQMHELKNFKDASTWKIPVGYNDLMVQSASKTWIRLHREYGRDDCKPEQKVKAGYVC